ncbi:MAG: DUF4271 domain-containing protein [Phaeodactylibacter sp.]|nr:DUF4271 domain-containing protein [Phaeodactylibacter sp.]
MNVRFQRFFRCWLGLVLLFGTPGLSQAQQTANPFEIGARVIPKDTAQETKGPRNPFDLVPEPVQPITAPSPIEAPVQLINPEEVPEVDTYHQFLFAVLITVLLLMAFLFILFRNFVSRAYRAFVNDNLLSQIHRDQGFVPSLPYLLFYLLFFINLGFFLFLFCKYFDLPVGKTDTYSLLILTGGVAALFIGKHLLLAIVEGIFPVEKEIRQYNFTIVIFSIIIGLVMVPLNLLIAYGPEGMLPMLFWITLGLIGLVYLYRILRGIFIANRFLALHQFHFLLYICTVEIAPVMVVVKILLDYL